MRVVGFELRECQLDRQRPKVVRAQEPRLLSGRGVEPGLVLEVVGAAIAGPVSADGVGPSGRPAGTRRQSAWSAARPWSLPVQGVESIVTETDGAGHAIG